MCVCDNILALIIYKESAPRPQILIIIFRWEPTNGMNLNNTISGILHISGIRISSWHPDQGDLENC